MNEVSLNPRLTVFQRERATGGGGVKVWENQASTEHRRKRNGGNTFPIFPLRKRPLHLWDQDWLHGVSTAQSHSLGLMPQGHCLVILNNFIFESELCRWSLTGQWNVCWRLGISSHTCSHLPLPPGARFSAAHVPLHPMTTDILAPSRVLGTMKRAGVGCTWPIGWVAGQGSWHFLGFVLILQLCPCPRDYDIKWQIKTTLTFWERVYGRKEEGFSLLFEQGLAFLFCIGPCKFGLGLERTLMGLNTNGSHGCFNPLPFYSSIMAGAQEA